MEALSWRDFEPTTVREFRPRSPQAELVDVLRRYRSDVDAAARSAADARAETLRALAEQAVLAAQLEKLLDREPALDDPRLRMLRALKDRMLEQIEATGLEVMHLEGASADEVFGMVEIERWRFAESYPAPVVVEELEVAVRLDGSPLRLGRVIMGAPPEHPVASPIDLVRVDEPAGEPGPVVKLVVEGRAGATLACPIEDCGTPNDPDAECCAGCLTQLVGYRRLTLYPELLFNRGLEAARSGNIRAARDFFAAVALWLPDDARARNAYALACLDGGDRNTARRVWSDVLELCPDDALAPRGLWALGEP